jgi:hypothetical protein
MHIGFILLPEGMAKKETADINVTLASFSITVSNGDLLWVQNQFNRKANYLNDIKIILS